MSAKSQPPTVKPPGRAWKCPLCEHRVGGGGLPEPPEWALYCDNGHPLTHLEIDHSFSAR